MKKVVNIEFIVDENDYHTRVLWSDRSVSWYLGFIPMSKLQDVVEISQEEYNIERLEDLYHKIEQIVN